MSKSNQISESGELLEYQHPGFLAFMQALLFDTETSLGANNPNAFSTFKSGFIALGATWVGIHFTFLVLLTMNFELQVANEISRIRSHGPRNSELFIVRELFDVFSWHHAHVAEVRTQALDHAFQKVIVDGM